MTSTQLTDTQKQVLESACGREGGLVLPIEGTIKGGALRLVLQSLIKRGLIEEAPAEPGQEVWREDGDGLLMALRVTPDGQRAVPPNGQHAVGEPSRKQRRTGTKQEAMIARLRRPEGASVQEIMAETGWQAHTVRGAISGGLKKKLGLAITSEKIEGRGRVYLIFAG